MPLRSCVLPSWPVHRTLITTPLAVEMIGPCSGTITTAGGGALVPSESVFESTRPDGPAATRTLYVSGTMTGVMVAPLNTVHGTGGLSAAVGHEVVVTVST